MSRGGNENAGMFRLFTAIISKDEPTRPVELHKDLVDSGLPTVSRRNHLQSFPASLSGTKDELAYNTVRHPD